jgi:repressor LexA
MVKGVVPIVGEIACGQPITAEQNIDGLADLPDGVTADFALRCKGDSMTPTFQPGDLVLIRQQPEVQQGQIAAVGIDGEATLKRFYKSGEGVVLVADNPAYLPQVYQAETEVKVYGLAVGFVRMFGKEKA